MCPHELLVVKDRTCTQKTRGFVLLDLTPVNLKKQNYSNLVTLQMVTGDMPK